jgi:hypothetical protein
MLILLSSIFDINTPKNSVLLSAHWGKFGVGIVQNLYNSFLETIMRGLQNLHPPVQIRVLPSLQTSHSAGFSCFYPDWRLCLIGVKPQNIRAYQGKSWGRI